MTFFIQGLLLGFAYVIPIGTQNMFVINTALTQKRKRVIATALVVCFFDVVLAAACFFGVGAIISAVKWLQLVILGIGSLVVIWIGIGLIRSSGSLDTDEDVTMPMLSVIWKACVVTWFNPQAIIDGTMLLGAFRAALPGGSGIAFIIGVCIASFVWWMTMSSVVNLFAYKINDKLLRIINIVCGAIIVFYGLKLIWNFFQIAGIF